ncbi:MAG: hypothetical protein IPK58_13755 [Acidobacteria bacterium]|nr:hypothetical protein [Acidobacteriota bacterium]
MRLSNIKAGVNVDVDDTEVNKPTLKRRQPDQDSPSTTTPGDNPDKQEGPPQLKKRTEPTPIPTPTPDQ